MIESLTDEQLDEFIDIAESHIGGDEWWLDDFFEQAEQVGKDLKKARANRRVPTRKWMHECRAPKCGCGGNPQWHADKAAGEEERQRLARESRKTHEPRKESRMCACGCGYRYVLGECKYGSGHGP
jgi:hypothetical protein